MRLASFGLVCVDGFGVIVDSLAQEPLHVPLVLGLEDLKAHRTFALEGEISSWVNPLRKAVICCGHGASGTPALAANQG